MKKQKLWERFKMSIYVTGDFHGDMTRLLEFKLANLGKEDYIIVAGDFIQPINAFKAFW